MKPQSNYDKMQELHSQYCRPNPRRDRDFYSRIGVLFSSQAEWEQEDQVKQTYPCVYHFLAEESGDLPIAGSVSDKLFEHANKRIDIS